MQTIPGVIGAASGITYVFTLLTAFALEMATGLSNPWSGVEYNNQGYALYEKHDLDGAIAHYRKALRLSPDLAEIRNNLGLAFYEKHELDAAIAHYRQALRLNPKLALAHNNLGLALYDNHDLDGAIAELREAVRLDPENAMARNNLSFALSKGYHRKAVHELRRGDELAPGDGVMRDVLEGVLKQSSNEKAEQR